MNFLVIFHSIAAICNCIMITVAYSKGEYGLMFTAIAATCYAASFAALSLR